MKAKKIRLMLAADASGETEQILETLYPGPESSLELTVVSVMSTLLATLDRAAPEAILLDLALTLPDPIEGVRRVHRAAPGVPLIVIADPADKNLAMRSLSEGAVDYLLKGFMDARMLERVLRTAQERNTFDGLADLLRDPVTGLYNRDGFLAIGMRCLEAAQHNGGTLVLLCGLLENLDSVREELGRGACDRMVREAAALLEGCFRRSDFVARIGESQFAALAVDAAEPSAPVLRQRVEKRLTMHNQTCDLSSSLPLRISVGFWGAHDRRTFPELLDAVETALRQRGTAPEESPAPASETSLKG